MKTREQFQKILDQYGGETANETIKMLVDSMNDKANLYEISDFISKNWRDPLAPAMMALSCKMVGGKCEETKKHAVALSLLNLSMRTWDDVIDKTSNRRFRLTTVGKFGEKNSIVIGGIISAKAFLIVNQIAEPTKVKEKVSKILWGYLTAMAEAEILDNRNNKVYSSKNKLKKIRSEAIGLETCLRIGGTIGNASEEEISALGNYGRTLGLLVELWKDLQVSLNLTIELEQKIKNKKLPFFVLRTLERDIETKNVFEEMARSDVVDSDDIDKIVQNVLKENNLIINKNVSLLTQKGLKLIKKFDASGEKRKMEEILSIQPLIFGEYLNGFNYC